ncbi:RNA polymerase sigma factor [Streptomyces sp. NPDC058657]|uniref:RNA polymerase sigma factor n=1 Tax=Streptomyces sp. NPDC058657 TaxID=3346579 RepID=UPI003650DF32
MYRHAVRSCGDWSLAQDVVSLTFLEAWRRREKLRDEGESVRPWLLGIATNVHAHRRFRPARVCQPVGGGADHPGGAGRPRFAEAAGGHPRRPPRGGQSSPARRLRTRRTGHGLPRR